MPLIIFIDALPFTFIEQQNKLMKEYDLNYSKLTPNIGYSSNLHWQLFGNIYPDEIGFFTDWNSEFEKNKKILAASKILPIFEFNTISGVISKKLTERVIGGRFANIPSKIRRNFTESAQYLLSSKDKIGNLKYFEKFQFILEDELGYEVDELINLMSKEVLEQPNLFVSYSFCDKYGHLLGRTKEYDSLITSYLRKILKNVDLYQKKWPHESIIIVSDHGMSNMNKNVSHGLEVKFGKQSEENYIAFCDSAILRVWTKNKILQKNIEEYLAGIKYGHLLSHSERIRYKITSENFGNIIFNLHEGFNFSPNYFGVGLRTKVKGMHGYWPGADDQNGVIISNTELKSSYVYEDFYPLLKEAIGDI